MVVEVVEEYGNGEGEGVFGVLLERMFRVGTVSMLVDGVAPPLSNEGYVYGCC